MTYSVEQRRADLASLRRVAQQMRADRQLDSALQLEAVIREREAELEAVLAAAPRPRLPITVTSIAALGDGGWQGIELAVTGPGGVVRVAALARGEHAEERAGWFALTRAKDALPPDRSREGVANRRVPQLYEEWHWSEPLDGGAGEWVMERQERHS